MTSSRELDNLVEHGLLKLERPDQREFDGLVASGQKRLADAKRGDLSEEGRFDLAYNAAHSLALAAMRWHGYRPANKRYIVFQTLTHTLGIKPDVWRILDKCHGLRNSLEYDGAFNVNTQLLKDLLAAADTVEKVVSALGPIKSAIN